MNNLLLTYYGDDFTGSTDVMEALTLGGLRTVLFLQPPTTEQVAQFSGLRCFGVAGVSRSMTPIQMETELRPKFRQLRQFGAPFFHYKVCSTFDSSPEIGSIGRAIDIGREVFASRWVPLIVAAPVLRRYVAFGNLFATVGGETYRLDRHPTMSRHPITPMLESDLRRHLAGQTDRPSALIDLLALDDTEADLDQILDELLNTKAEIVLFDTLNEHHLARIGGLLWRQRNEQPLFVAGSSGVEYALTAYLSQIGLLPPRPSLTPPGTANQMIVMTGSAAPPTAAQIAWAEEHGFVGVRLDTLGILDDTRAEAAMASALQTARQSLAGGSSVVLYAAKGPDDPALAQTRAHARDIGLAESEIGQVLARRQAQLLRRLLETVSVRRVCVAGGDTSGYAALALGIFALEMIVPVAPGAPLCRAYASDACSDGLEISLKGGQNGREDYFGLIRAGGQVTP